MTQLIAATCNKGLEIVLVSDRMITKSAGGNDYLHFEHEPKMDKLTNFICALSTGSVHETQVIEDSSKEITEHTSIRNVAEILAKNFRSARRNRIEQIVLSKYGLTSFDDYYNKQRLLLESTNEAILDDLEEFDDFDLQFLIAGMDDDSISHIYEVRNPGICRSYDVLQFCCLGSGEDQAETVFAIYGYRQAMPKEVVLQLAYMAKKRAEMASGVGQSTDAWIIDSQGIARVMPETINTLEEIYGQQKLFDSLSSDLEIKAEYLNGEDG